MRIGIDIGGTFTDLLLVDDDSGRSTVVKTLTTPDDPSRAVDLAVREALGDGSAAGSVRNVIHGTTLVTNAIIERKGERTALITTRGFRDVLEIRREHRYDMYDLFLEPPKAIVPRHLRFEVDERLLADGSVLLPLDTAAVERLGSELAARGIERHRRVAASRLPEPAPRAAIRQILARCAPDAAGLAFIRSRQRDQGVRADVDDGRATPTSAAGR